MIFSVQCSLELAPEKSVDMTDPMVAGRRYHPFYFCARCFNCPSAAPQRLVLFGSYSGDGSYQSHQRSVTVFGMDVHRFAGVVLSENIGLRRCS